MATLAWKNPLRTAQLALPLHPFNRDYLRRLANGDDAVEHHFSSYFGCLLLLKLRGRIRSPQLAEDIRQETLLRVLQIVRNAGVQHPERFGAFVSAVCNNVMMELLRGEIQHESFGPKFEPADETVDLEFSLVTKQRRREVDAILEELSEKDRELLRMFFLEECDRSEICKRFNVGENYLRVLLHRAKLRFRSIHSERFSGSSWRFPIPRRSTA